MLKLHAGVSKKVGLPGFSSASASCTIEAELDGALLNDTQGFHIVVRRAYQSCEQAVQDEIARLQGHDGASQHSAIHGGADRTTSGQHRIQDFAPSPSPDSAQCYPSSHGPRTGHTRAARALLAHPSRSAGSPSPSSRSARLQPSRAPRSRPTSAPRPNAPRASPVPVPPRLPR
jgi:hypothetical protein